MPDEGLFFKNAVKWYKTIAIGKRIVYIGKVMFEIDNQSFKSSKKEITKKLHYLLDKELYYQRMDTPSHKDDFRVRSRGGAR